MPVIYCLCDEEDGLRAIALACPLHGLESIVRQGERLYADLVEEAKKDGFPIMQSKRIASIPWKLIEPHRAQAHKNTGQSLERLAARGGLGPLEAWSVLTDEPCPYFQSAVVDEGAKEWCEQFLVEASIGSIEP